MKDFLTRIFEDGVQRCVPSLCQLLQSLLDEEEISEARLRVIEVALKRAPWDTDLTGLVKVFSMFAQRATASNISLYLILSRRMLDVSQLAYKREILQKHLEEAVMKMFKEHVFPCAWAPSIKLSCALLQEEFSALFRTIAATRTLDNKSLTWKELLPFWSFWSAVVPSESMGSLKMCVDEMCVEAASGKLSEALDVLYAAIGDLRKARGDDALGDDALSSLFLGHSPYIKTLPELSKLLSLRNAELSSEVSTAVLEVYRDVVSRLAYDCRTCLDLERLYKQVMEDVRLEFAATEFSSIAAKRVVEFPPKQIISWLESESYGALKVPSAKQLISTVVLCAAEGSFEDFVRLLKYIEISLDVSGENLPEAFRKMVGNYCSRDASGVAFCDVVALLPSLSQHADSVLEVLSTLLGNFVKPSSNLYNNTAFMGRFCGSLPKGVDLDPPISKLMDNVIAALLKTVELNERSLVTRFGSIWVLNRG
jgi:hypothetical protein